MPGVNSEAFHAMENATCISKSVQNVCLQSQVRCVAMRNDEVSEGKGQAILTTIGMEKFAK